MLTDSYYHILLRISALTLSLILLFVSGVVSPATGVLSENTALQVANTIGMYASVPANEINTLNAALEEKGRQIAEREIRVALKEKETEQGDMSVFVLSVLVFILVVLMVINYALDFARVRTGKVAQQQNEKMA